MTDKSVSGKKHDRTTERFASTRVEENIIMQLYVHNVVYFTEVRINTNTWDYR